MFQLILTVVSLLPIALGVPSTFDTEHVWVPGNLAIPFPRNAIAGGFYPDGSTLYVGRFLDVNKNVLPVRVVARSGLGYYGAVNPDGGYYKGVVKEYQILVPHSNMTYKWDRSFDGVYEEGAVVVGTLAHNELATVCRSWIKGSLMVGYVAPSLKECYIDDVLISNKSLTIQRHFPKYEILRATPKLCGYGVRFRSDF